MSAEAKKRLETISAHMDALIGLCFTLGDGFSGDREDPDPGADQPGAEYLNQIFSLAVVRPAAACMGRNRYFERGVRPVSDPHSAWGSF